MQSFSHKLNIYLAFFHHELNFKFSLYSKAVSFWIVTFELTQNFLVDYISSFFLLDKISLISFVDYFSSFLLLDNFSSISLVDYISSFFLLDNFSLIFLVWLFQFNFPCWTISHKLNIHLAFFHHEWYQCELTLAELKYVFNWSNCAKLCHKLNIYGFFFLHLLN